MNLYQVRDVVREQVGGAEALSEASLTWCVEKGLRDIEKSGNWYWMNALKTASLVVDQGEYSIYTSTSSGLNIPNFKDSRILLVQDATLTHPFWDEVEGPKTIEEIKVLYATDDTGMPRYFTIREGNTDATLELWPPDPDKTYSINWHYFQWTSLPTDVTSDDHEVLMRWPEALIYLATAQGMILKTKDLQAGAFWQSLYRNPNIRIDDEYKKIQRYNNDRENSTRITLVPRTGTAARRRDPFRGGNY